jgi:gliding motility-associated-like protein
VQSETIKTNIFTPNGAGINDLFKLFNLADYPTVGVKTYNRWVKLADQSDAYKNDWNGGHLKKKLTSMWLPLIVKSTPMILMLKKSYNIESKGYFHLIVS